VVGIFVFVIPALFQGFRLEVKADRVNAHAIRWRGDDKGGRPFYGR
jgi:hypothetical protein